MAQPYLKLYKMNSSGDADESTELDITTFIADGGLTIEHEDIDSDKSGRDVKTGLMVRERITKKHTITVKLRRSTAETIAEIYDRLFANDDKKPYFFARYVHPCHNSSNLVKFYCSSFNYGAQRYVRGTNSISYDGATFKIIQR